MNIGYCRVSTSDQDYSSQSKKLESEGCEKIFSEKQSGKSANDRKQLKAAINHCREGDVFIITKLDRLARSMGDLSMIVNQLESKGVGFKVLEQDGLDTSGACGKLLFNILGSIAEFERDLINARTAEGRKAAQAKGVKFGRKPKLSDDQIKAIKADVSAGELTKQAIAEKYGIARNSVYRLAKT